MDADLVQAVQSLARFNQWRLAPGEPKEGQSEKEEGALGALELSFLEGELQRVRARAAEAPSRADAFVEWFEALEKTGPGQNDPLFVWLEHEAPIEAMKWFLRQELAGEAGFDDLVALTQVKMPARVKLELARNYWDEMGQGHLGGMHGPMLSRLAAELGVEPQSPEEAIEGVMWESLALANTMVALAMHRRHAYRSIGALGAIELTAPGRAKRVNAGLKRLGVAGEARRYFALHATLDVKHSADWNREVLRPLVESDPRVALPLAEGALVRLAAGDRCFERYRRELGVDEESDPHTRARTPRPMCSTTSRTTALDQR